MSIELVMGGHAWGYDVIVYRMANERVWWTVYSIPAEQVSCLSPLCSLALKSLSEMAMASPGSFILPPPPCRTSIMLIPTLLTCPKKPFWVCNGISRLFRPSSSSLQNKYHACLLFCLHLLNNISEMATCSPPPCRTTDILVLYLLACSQQHFWDGNDISKFFHLSVLLPAEQVPCLSPLCLLTLSSISEFAMASPGSFILPPPPCRTSTMLVCWHLLNNISEMATCSPPPCTTSDMLVLYLLACSQQHFWDGNDISKFFHLSLLLPAEQVSCLFPLCLLTLSSIAGALSCGTGVGGLFACLSTALYILPHWLWHHGWKRTDASGLTCSKSMQMVCVCVRVRVCVRACSRVCEARYWITKSSYLISYMDI